MTEVRAETLFSPRGERNSVTPSGAFPNCRNHRASPRSVGRRALTRRVGLCASVKSDDVTGRSRIYEAIVKGEQALSPGIPESFNVLVKELQGLCLDIRMEKALSETEQKEGRTATDEESK